MHYVVLRLTVFLSLLLVRPCFRDATHSSVVLMYFYIPHLGVASYDFLVTFPSEIRCIWQRKFDVATFLLFVVRYATLFDVFVWIVFSLSSTISAMPDENEANSVRLLTLLLTIRNDLLIFKSCFRCQSRQLTRNTLTMKLTGCYSGASLSGIPMLSYLF